MSDSCRDDYMDDKEYYKYDPNEYDNEDEYDNNDNEYDNFIIFNNYDELMNLSKHDKTDNKLRDIINGLIKYKKKEVGFTFDYTIAPKDKWLDIAKEFNSTIIGRDYRILIDEDAIVCYVINDYLLK